MSDPATKTDAVSSWDAEEAFETTKVSFEQWNMLFGLQSTVLFYLGYQIYNWYPATIEENYIERVDGDYINDLEWAKSTREIMAWTNVSNTLLWVQGGYWLIWLANYSLDNEGGQLHHLYYIAMKSSQLFPWVLTYLAYCVNVAYPQSKSVEQADIDLAQPSASTAVWKKQYYYYIYTNYGSTQRQYDTDQVTRQIYLWVAAFTSQVMNAYAVPALTAKWDESHSLRVEAEEAEIAAAKAAAAEK